jgi:competence protein ComEC
MSVVIDAKEYTAVVDCGSNSGENAGATAHEHLLSQGRTTLDLLIITHFHSDHANGVAYLITQMDVSALAIPDPDGPYIAEDIIELARRRGTDIIYVTETLRVELGDMTLMLYPPLGSGDENEKGLAVLALGGVNALITGDMNSPGERALLRFAALPHIDLLVVGHHGSRFSTCEELLAAVMPNVAVIPVGRNSYGHPSEETITRLDDFSATVYRTDTAGHVTVKGR